ncbi:MAG: chlorophyll synthase ChlG [Myxococcota bacterium]
MNTYLQNIKYGWELLRPFTLTLPALGIISGAITAYGAFPRFSHGEPSTELWLFKLALGAVAAAILNGASNTLNQIYDLEIDRINKPDRILPSGKLQRKTAASISVSLYILALLAAFLINLECFLMFLAAALATVLYSAPPFRLKRFGWLANLTIAIPRGVLLKVAGWSISKPIMSLEAWFIGAIFGLFLLGATSSKDFADIEGDKACGCRTLPIIYGKEKAIKVIHPFYTLPFILLPVGALLGALTGNAIAISLLGLICAFWGHRVILGLLKDPSEKLTENHPSWRQMYFIIFALQIGFIIAYVV